uniref:Uncharacterized protein n=1 Tax=Kalanchoe fedtschenkoi TaxID=63787 RepID=A0A7N0U725_KALFE
MEQQQDESVPQSTFTASSKLDPSRLPSPQDLSCQRNLANAWRGGCLDLDIAGDGSGRERLKRHRNEVAGRVVVPDKWSQEEMLKEWLDFASFDALLAPKGFDLARAALVAERRKQAKEAVERDCKGYLGMQFSATRCN